MIDHAVAKYFRRHQEKAIAKYRPTSTDYIEQNISLKAHTRKTKPLFFALRDNEGDRLATVMLPPGGESNASS